MFQKTMTLNFCAKNNDLVHFEVYYLNHVEFWPRVLMFDFQRTKNPHPEQRRRSPIPIIVISGQKCCCWCKYHVAVPLLSSYALSCRDFRTSLLLLRFMHSKLEAVPEKCSLGLTFNDGSLFPHASGDPQNDAVRLHQLLQCPNSLFHRKLYN